MKCINIKNVKRIICFMMTAAMIFACFFNDSLALRVKAEDVYTGAAGTVSPDGNSFYLRTESGAKVAEFTLTSTSDGMVLSYYGSGVETVSINEGNELICENNTRLIISEGSSTKVNISTAETGAAVINGNNEGYIHNASNGIITGTGSNQGEVVNEGSFKIGTLLTTGYSSNSGTMNVISLIVNEESFENTGTINTSGFGTTGYLGSFTNKGTITSADILITDVISDASDNPVYNVSNSLEIRLVGVGFGTVNATADTDIIVSTGSGSALIDKLVVGDKSQTNLIVPGNKTYTAGYLVKNNPDFNVSIPDILAGTDYNLMNYCTCTSDGNITAKYFVEDSEIPDKFNELSERPTEPGDYYVEYYVEETADYKDSSYSAEYSIVPLTASDDPNLGATFVGDPYYTNGTYNYYNAPVKVVANDGFEISVDDSEYANTYTYSADTYNYGSIRYRLRRKSDNATTDYMYMYTTPFYLDLTAPFIPEDSVINQDGDKPSVTLEDGASFHAKKIEFDIEDADCGGYGAYENSLKSVKVNGTALEEASFNGNHSGAHVTLATDKEEKEFAIVAEDLVGNKLNMTVSLEYKDTPTTTVSMSDSLYGVELPDPVITSTSDQIASAYKIYYKKAGEEDDAFTTTKPSEVGNYIVKVEIPETSTCFESIEYDEFSISYLAAPSDPYVVNGTKGKNNYYVTDVSLEAKDGYMISTSIDGIYGTSIPYDSDITRVWLKRTSDGAITDEIPVEELLVDKDKPKLSNAYDQDELSYELSDGKELKVGTLKFDITDENLTAVKVDGKSYTISSGKASINLTIEKGTDKDYSIYAEDKAGNKTEMTIHIQSLEKLTPVTTLAVDDSYVGDIYTVEFDTDSDGKDDAVIEFKKKGEDDTKYQTVKPTAAGDYIARVTVPETTKYLQSVLTDEFTISKKTVTVANVSINDSFVGEEYEPVLTTDSDGADKNVFLYKKDGEEDSTYSSTKPVSAGLYVVKANIPETDIYLAAECTDTFTIEKKTVEVAEVKIDDLLVDQEYVPVLTTDSDGADKTIFFYKLDGALDSTYNIVKPEKAGKYIVKASIPETDKYFAAECTDDFTIGKKTAETAEVTVVDTFVGEDYDPVLTTDSDGKESAVFEYKKDGAADSTFNTSKPEVAGKYVVRATIPETDKYLEVQCTNEFTIGKKTVETAEVIVPNVMVGEEYEPVLTTDSDGKDLARYEYKLENDDDSTYSTVKPLVVGNYVVRATIPETDKYLAAEAISTFRITAKKLVGIEVKVADTFVGTEYEPVISTDSDGKDKAVYEYKLEDEEDSKFVTTKPEKAGTYILRVTVPETDEFEEIVGTCTFSIKKKTAKKTEVSVADVEIGTEFEVAISTDSDGKKLAVIEYKKEDAKDSAYSIEKPEKAGTYIVRVTIPETEKYLEAQCTATFKISKLKVTKASVSVGDSYVGADYEPVLTTDSNGKGKTTFEYKKDGADDSEYSNVKPTAAGKYVVRAKIPETGKYLSARCKSTFTISKKEVKKATVKVGDSKVGSKYEVILVTDSDGAEKAVYEYKKKDSDDSTYVSKKPSKAGTYIVRVKIPETAMYLKKECTASFTISKFKVSEISLSVEDIFVGQQIKTVLKSDSDGKKTATYEYKPTALGDEAYTTEKPVAAGEYTVKATVPETDMFESASCTAKFRIKRIQTTAKLTMDTVYAGTDYKPTITTDSDGVDGAVYSYKSVNASDDFYTGTKPTMVGDYTLRVVIPATGTYESITTQMDYKVVYLDTPSEPFTPSGTLGKNDYYTTDVILNAPGGYQISTALNGVFATSVPYSENMGPVYLRRDSDGALTNAIAIQKQYKIDKENPSILPASGTAGMSGIVDGATTYADMVTMNVADVNLDKVTLNSESVNVSDGKAQLILNSENGVKTFIVEAEDKAGNKMSFEITLMAEWLIDRVIPANKVLPLETEGSYKLDDGEWTVSGDPTVYNGGRSVYVKDAGDYTFSNGN